MPNLEANKSRLLEIVKARSVFYGDFVLASGARSSHYFDCRLTSLNPEGAWLVGNVLLDLIRAEETARGLRIEAVGGLTMGADPISLAVGISSHLANPQAPIEVFVVRKAPKDHGQTKLIEGPSVKGRSIAVIDDVITRGDSTLKAVDAIEAAGGKVVLAAVLVDREEGGRAKIEARGIPVISVFRKSDVLRPGG